MTTRTERWALTFEKHNHFILCFAIIDQEHYLILGRYSAWYGLQQKSRCPRETWKGSKFADILKHFIMFSWKTKLFFMSYILIQCWVQLQIGLSLLEATCTQGKLRCLYILWTIFQQIYNKNIYIYHFLIEKKARFWNVKLVFHGFI